MTRHLPPGLMQEGVGESAWQRVRRDILSGHLSPGQKLGLEVLRASYGLSVSTLREILNRLASEGLVIAEGQRGFAVAPVSARNLREIQDLRLVLEGRALADSLHKGDAAWEDRVAAAHAVLAAPEPASAPARAYRERQFRLALISACGSSVLLQFCAAVFDKQLRYQLVLPDLSNPLTDLQCHVLREAALARDVAAACAIVKEQLGSDKDPDC